MPDGAAAQAGPVDRRPGGGWVAPVEVDLARLDAERRYRLLAGAVVPRPVAWVTSLGPGDTVNAAPFSFFAVMAVTPPLLGFAVADRPGGGPKDTLRNILERGEYVVNIACFALAGAVHRTAADLPPGASELELVGLTPAPMPGAGTPRIAEAPVSLACRLRGVWELGADHRWVVGEAVSAYVRPGVADERLRFDYDAFAPLGRLIGDLYLRPGGAVAVAP